MVEKWAKTSKNKPKRIFLKKNEKLQSKKKKAVKNNDKKNSEIGHFASIFGRKKRRFSIKKPAKKRQNPTKKSLDFLKKTPKKSLFSYKKNTNACIPRCVFYVFGRKFSGSRNFANRGCNLFLGPFLAVFDVKNGFFGVF
jgi:hypothetical protein